MTRLSELSSEIGVTIRYPDTIFDGAVKAVGILAN